MHKYFPSMLDRPETPQIIGSLFYSIIAFFSLPFILLLFMQGSFSDPLVTSIIEIIYHVINCVVAVSIFRTYLVDSFLNVQADTKLFWSTVEICVAAMFIYFYGAGALLHSDTDSLLNVAALGTLPLAEMELFTFSGSLNGMNPIFGTICMVFVVPFATSCLYYATVFAPVCTRKPWLAYILMVVFLAFPRFCNGMTYWNPAEEVVLYLTQLPLHLLSCWAYQRTDTIWTPIAAHAIVNAIVCGLNLLAMMRL